MKRRLKGKIAFLMAFSMSVSIPTCYSNETISGLVSAYEVSTEENNIINDEQGLTYTLDFKNQTAIVSCQLTSLFSIIIPKEITKGGKKYSVTSIGDMAFEDCSNLTEITIPDSVTYIGKYAFEGCSSLTEITIPDSVTYIDYRALSGTKWYDNQSDGVVYVGKVAYNYKGVIPENSKVILKDDTTSINSYAFSYHRDLTEITIPDSVTSIGEYAFEGCSSLTGITISDSVTSIGNSAFSYCSGLTEITIPDSVTSIDDCTFSGCSGLTEIKIPDSVTYIGAGTFLECSNLTEITIPDNVTFIGDYAFAYCSKLTEITIPDSVTYIGYRAFVDCYNLKINGYKNSYAEKYALEKDIPFITLDNKSDTLSGDLNNDNKLDATDIFALKKYLLNIYTSIDKSKADINNDGKVNIIDLSRLKNIILNN